MDADRGTLPTPKAADEVVDEGRRGRERGQTGIVRRLTSPFEKIRLLATV